MNPLFKNKEHFLPSQACSNFQYNYQDHNKALQPYKVPLLSLDPVRPQPIWDIVDKDFWAYM